MPITSTNYTDISYLAEVTPGTPVSSGAYQILPSTSGAPSANITTAVSEVIRSDRQVDDLIPVDADVAGDMNFELSYTPYKPLLQELLRGTVSTDTPIAGTDQVRNSNNTANTFTFCKRVLGITDPAYFYYTGCVISQMVFNFETGSILTGVMSVYGREELVGTASAQPAGIGSPTFTAIPAYTIMNSVQSVVTSITGLPAGTEYESLSLTINNNTTPAKGIGTLGAIDTADFTLDVMGDINLYFQDTAAYNLFKTAGDFQVESTLTDGAGNELKIILPYCKFETLDTPIEGKDNFLMLNGTLRALRDSTDNYTVGFEFTDI